MRASDSPTSTSALHARRRARPCSQAATSSATGLPTRSTNESGCARMRRRGRGPRPGGMRRRLRRRRWSPVCARATPVKLSIWLASGAVRPRPIIWRTKARRDIRPAFTLPIRCRKSCSSMMTSPLVGRASTVLHSERRRRQANMLPELRSRENSLFAGAPGAREAAANGRTPAYSLLGC